MKRRASRRLSVCCLMLVCCVAGQHATRGTGPPWLAARHSILGGVRCYSRYVNNMPRTSTHGACCETDCAHGAWLAARARTLGEEGVSRKTPTCVHDLSVRLPALGGASVTRYSYNRVSRGSMAITPPRHTGWEARKGDIEGGGRRLGPFKGWVPHLLIRQGGRPPINISRRGR